MNNEEKIDQIISRFNFEKIRAYMIIRGWKIETQNKTHHIPTEVELAEKARFLLSNVIQRDGSDLIYSPEYGLMAWKSEDDTLQLFFCIESKKSFLT